MIYLPAIYGPVDLLFMNDCGLTPGAAAFAIVWRHLLGEKADEMVCDSRLVKAAQDHATFLWQRVDTTPSMHIGRDGSRPNQRVRASGYQLPDRFADGNNNVESCTYSWKNWPEKVADMMASPPHHDHMHVTGWFSNHLAWGIGTSGKYAVVLTAPLEMILAG